MSQSLVRPSVARSSLVVEIRAAEGGDDAKALVKEQVALYARLATRREL
jgi:protein subunit release factor A